MSKEHNFIPYYFLNLPMSKMNIKIQEFYDFMKLRHIVRGFSFELILEALLTLLPMGYPKEVYYVSNIERKFLSDIVKVY